jgi:NAD(P)-dependent dehydrogenase (short-subunit alcohol dehydrogenase family)
MSVDELRFDGRVAIVTGAGRGMAREHALLLAARGAKVVVNDLGSETAGGGADPSVAAAVVEEIRAAGGEAVANTDSIATESGAQAVVATAIDSWGRLDTLINSAGIFETKPLAETDIENFTKHVTTNMIGTAAMCFAAWPHMVEGGYGRIVNTESSAGVLGMLSRISYAASKTGIIGITRCLAHEGAESGIKVNLVNPTARTRMWIDPATGTDWADVPPPPPPGKADPWRVPGASPMYLVLAHEACPTTGEMYNCGADRVNRQFFADTAGIEDPHLDPETIIERWAEVVDENDYFTPTPLRPYRGM